MTLVAEPNRSVLIPGFDQVKKAAIDTGALGCSISGSGPSIFALSKNEETALLVTTAMQHAYKDIGISFSINISRVNPKGITEI